jgi:predicted ATPase
MFDYIKIEGFRSFKKVELEMPRLAVLIGPNGGGKSNLVDLLMLMAEAGRGELAVGVNKRGGFRNIAFGFDSSQEVRAEFRFRELRSQISNALFVPEQKAFDIRYRVGLRGLGVNFRIWEEQVRVKPPDERSFDYGGAKMIVNTIVNRNDRETVFRSSKGAEQQVEERKSVEDIELAIFQVRDPDKYKEPWSVLQQLQGMAFYRDIDVGPDSRVRQPTLVRPDVLLLPDGSNLSSVLYSIQQGHPELWSEILEDLHTAYSDFVKLTVPAGGGDGKVHLRWFERPYEEEGMSANLLSDGTLKLLCLMAILKTPDPPSLICIDEPELGLHPDWIKLVAELLEDAATRTQVIVATHSPQIVAKLDPEQVIVTEKVEGETHLRQLKTPDLENWLKDFSLAELWLSGEIGGRP